MKKIIVDIDNTLWHFASILYERMKEINPQITQPSEWHDYFFWRSYLTPKEFYKVIKGIHRDQEMFNPYPDAELFLSSLKDMGFHITIASHREKETLHATINWLNRYNLVFDEVHLSYDKSVLLDNCISVIDDSPIILEKAANSGIICCGLKMPWNDNGIYNVFDTLTEILHYLRAKKLHEAK